MAQKQLEDEVQIILECVRNKQNFLLSGGAGSGKTYSLVQIIRQVIKEFPLNKVACMTYTNVAVKEIEDRVNHNNLEVTTIHDFLWSNIKNFQKDLKKGLIELINNEQSKITVPEGLVEVTYFDHITEGVQYKEYTRIKEGIISHDELLELANLMFKEHPLLCDIIKDKFKFIFIDEYQDTNPLVVNIFIESLKNSNKENIIGFFGDSMQSIYDSGIGELKNYIDCGDVIEIQKVQNRRNPQLVIELANKLRFDNLVQLPSNDPNAPNMVGGLVKKGNIKFLYSANEEEDLEKIKNTHHFEEWDFNDSVETKELYLTHNLIATKAGFSSLMEIYDRDPIIELKNDIRNKIKKKSLEVDESHPFDQIVDQIKPHTREKQLKKDLITNNELLRSYYNRLKDKPYFEVKNIYFDKDSLIDDKKQDTSDTNKIGSKRDNLMKHLFKIQRIIQLYQEKKYHEFIKNTEYKIKDVGNKLELFGLLKQFNNISDKSIEEIIDLADLSGICHKDDNYYKFIKENEYLFSRVKEIKYGEFQALFNYVEGFTPFSTQHKIKGAEFKNVLVVLDNGKWNNYNFEYLFTNNLEKESVLLRTKKIFYVCCTRAKDNLIVYFNNPGEVIVHQAIEWFGVDNVHKI